jgi:hypothetical protein
VVGLLENPVRAVETTPDSPYVDALGVLEVIRPNVRAAPPAMIAVQR